MKLYPIALLLALPLLAQAESRETKTTVYGRNVTVITDTVTGAPASLQNAFEQQLGLEGRHEQIYRRVSDDRAVTIVSERQPERCLLTATRLAPEVRITLWKAVVQNGKTRTETRIYRISPTEVNAFLDAEFGTLAADFEASPVRA